MEIRNDIIYLKSPQKKYKLESVDLPDIINEIINDKEKNNNYISLETLISVISDKKFTIFARPLDIYDDYTIYFLLLNPIDENKIYLICLDEKQVYSIVVYEFKNKESLIEFEKKFHYHIEIVDRETNNTEKIVNKNKIDFSKVSRKVSALIKAGYTMEDVLNSKYNDNQIYKTLFQLKLKSL